MTWKRWFEGDGSSRRLTVLIVLFPLVSLLLYGGLSHLFLLYMGKQESIRDLKRYEWSQMEIEKNLLKEKVESLARFIRYYDSRSSDKIKQDVAAVVRLVAAVADNLCEKNRDIASEKLKRLIVSAFEKIRFEKDLGYLFIIDMAGNVLLHPDPGMMGTNIRNIQDINGKYIVREFERIIRERGEGFVDYYWYIPSQSRDRMYYKISYVKKLRCFDWYVGAGEYLRYMKRFVREEILKYIADNGRFEEGFFYITDSNGRFVYLPPGTRRERLLSYRVEGVYEEGDILAYTEYIAPYDWYLTAVRRLDGVRREIAAKSREIDRKGEENAQTNLLLLLLSWLVSLVLSLWLSWIMNGMLRRYEERIRESNDKLIWQSRQALLGELLPMIAHQWRQPINKIASILALLRFGKDREDPAALDRHYRKMEESIEFMSETIEDFRNFYRPKNRPEPADLAALIRRSAEFVEGMIKKRGITLRFELSSVSCETYANELMQVLINLIKNAADAMPGGGELHIVLGRHDGGIRIVVEDSGEGIPPGDEARVYEAYYTTKSDSMGLGLYMSKMIVEKHMGGKITARRRPEGGSAFVIYLPCDAPVERARTGAQASL